MGRNEPPRRTRQTPRTPQATQSTPGSPRTPQSQPDRPTPPTTAHPRRPVRPATPTGRRPSLMIVPGLAAVAGRRAQPRHHQNHNPGGQLFKNNGPRLPAGSSQKGAPKGSRKYTKSGLQGKRPGGTPRIWPTTRLTRTKPCMALNLATVLHFQDTDRGPQNPGCHGPELTAMLKEIGRAHV